MIIMMGKHKKLKDLIEEIKENGLEHKPKRIQRFKNCWYAIEVKGS